MNIRHLRNLVNTMPFNALVGIRLVRLHRDGVTLACAVREDLLNVSGVLHGGVAATLADAAVGVALQRHLGGKRAITTTELKINYLRPVAQGVVSARSRLLKVGTKMAVGSVDIKNAAGELVAAALLSYMLL